VHLTFEDAWALGVLGTQQQWRRSEGRVAPVPFPLEPSYT